MFSKWTVIVSVLICIKGFALGSISPEKPSDYSMYDNQFYRVGDTELDDEVTDCALVEHQFKKGYIRLREYLERKRGCGRRGKLTNIEGIEKSTEDDINKDNIAEIAKSTTEDYDYGPESYKAAVKQAPKPITMPQVIKTFQGHKLTQVPYHYAFPAKAAVPQPVSHVSFQRNQPSRPTIADYENHSQDLALSFKSNPQYTTLASNSLEKGNYGSPTAQSYLASSFQDKLQSFNKTATKPVNSGEKNNENENIDDAHADMRDPDTDAADDNSKSIDQEPPSEPGIDDEPAGQTMNERNKSLTGRRPQNLKNPTQQAFISKGNPMFVKEPQDTSNQYQTAPASDTVNLPQPSINFDILKNRIMHSTNTTFLRRMLTLIRKITHHKDFQKLQGPARSFVAQADTAVQTLKNTFSKKSSTSPTNAGTGNQLNGNDFEVTKKSTAETPGAAYNSRIMMSPYANAYAQRKKSAVQIPSTAYNRRITMSSGNQHADNLYGNVYAQRKKFAVQRPITAYRSRIAMAQGSLRNGNIYDYAQRKKTAVQALNRALYSNRMAISSVNPGTVNQFYGNDYSLSKKFEIARNPYYANYYQLRQPYYRNIASMRYGLYNGNTP
ncbi:PREDICTED: uncharacterized protein LOC107354506 [Acropora digitifera]|uniref:uncharacterized protein LOC107354506 n=1 Tax=Acropora digitifera TaxID=70779 RepID=UPI000779F290|nr:PREDICTED: uncharacterized protein LOC107354506 [Acropora digitifera]